MPVSSSALHLRPRTLRLAGQPLQGRCRMNNTFGAASRDVAVGFIPADSALESCGDRAGAETKLALGPGAIHEHFVASDFHAFHRNLRLAKRQARKNGIRDRKSTRLNSSHSSISYA